MESSGGFIFNDTKQTMRKKRSDRRPRTEIQQEHNNSSLSSSPPSNNVSKTPSDDTGGHEATYHRKKLNLNQCNSRASYTNSEPEIQASSDDKDTGADTSEVFASNYKDGQNSGSLDADSDAKGFDNVVKKVKLKVGGVIRTIHTNTNPSVLKPPRHSKQKQNSQENPDPSGLRGIPWKDFSRSGFSVGKSKTGSSTTEESITKNRKNPINNNSKRMAKKRVLNDNEDDDEDDDAELRYLAKMKMKSVKVDDEDESGSKKSRKISSVLKMESEKEKERKKMKTGTDSEDNDYTGEGEESSREMMTVTTRRKALQSGRGDNSGDVAAGVVEFPNGLPPAAPRSKEQKEKLSEVELQLKKAEAAQRRKIQAAKAAQESEAEAIRKILGQESSRKKRETKQKQRQEELAQERNSNAATLSSNTVRLMIGPTGTVVTFSEDIGLPNIFESKPSSYPPPREKCAGPSCSNPFKYRDSRSKLPLCSLQCYKAVQQLGPVY